MNYKELLNRYKKGLVNEEEKKLVEEELEKQLAIEEYVSETFNEAFDDITKPFSADMHDEETQKLKKNVNNRLRKVVVKSVLIVLALYIGVFYIGSAIVDKIYYDPTSVTKSEEGKAQFTDFYYDIQAYISLNMPGHVIDAITLQKSKGFGNYELSYAMKELFTKDEQRYFMDISRERLTHGFDGIFSRKYRLGIWKGFERIQFDVFKDISKDNITFLDRDIQKDNEKTIGYLNELNPLSYVSMNIVFKEDLTMEEFYNMTYNHPSIDFKWVGIRTVEPGTRWNETEPMHLIGFNPNPNDEINFNQRPDFQKYPIFNLSDRSDYPMESKKDYPEAISEAYRVHFKSRLEYLRDREDFVKIFDYNHLKTDFYNDSLSYVNENGVKTYGVLVFGRADELLREIDKIPYKSIYMNKVLPTKPNIYHDN